jgi:hypothetical protein
VSLACSGALNLMRITAENGWKLRPPDLVVEVTPDSH